MQNAGTVLNGSACGASSGQDHSGGAGIIEANEQVSFPPLPCDR